MDIQALCTNLQNHDGIWYAATKSAISYPSDANLVYAPIEEKSFWFQHRNEMILAAFKNHAKQPVLFDIGGGNGMVSKFLQENQIETILIEPGEAGILNAQKRGIKHLVCSTFQEAGFRENIFDNAGLFDVVEHIEDDLGFLKQIHFYLKDEGRVFITVPAFRYLWSQNDDNAGHYRRYTIESLSKVARAAGFEPVYSTYFFSLLPLPILMFRSLPYQLGIRFKDIYKKGGKEHQKGMFSGISERVWRNELVKVKANQPISSGSSCMMVLKKA